MSETRDLRTPFILGKPIKNPADFYGRRRILRELYQAVLNAELVALVGEHRCGNTSIIYQLLHEQQRAAHLSPEQDAGLVFALVSSQLATEGPDALLRRIARAVRRTDVENVAAPGTPADSLWFENYLDDLADRRRRLVLLVDEFEVLASFEPSFWDWFQTLVTERDVSMVVTTHTDLSRFRTERRAGPPFYNMFRSTYVGSFCPTTVDQFLREKSEITEFDFSSVRDTIDELAGRYPYYLQVAAALFYLFAGGESRVSAHQIEQVRTEFKLRTAALFEDAWRKLPQSERCALALLSVDKRPEDGEEEFEAALESLERRGYVLEGRIFSSALADFVRERARWIAVNRDTGMARVGTRHVAIGLREMALLQLLVDNEARVIPYGEIVQALEPDPVRRSDLTAAQVDAVARQLQEHLASLDPSRTFIEPVAGVGYRLNNPPITG